MSTFINKEDYSTNINGNVLDQITQFDDSKIDRCEAVAISKVKGFLAVRYNTDEIFNKTGDDRHPMILDCCIKICLYELHTLINPRKTPEYRKEANDRAIEWLKMLQEGLLEQPDLPRIESPSGDYIKYGSNPIRDNRF